MEWIADNLIRIEYIGKDEAKFRIFFDIDRDNVMRSLSFAFRLCK